MNIRLLAPAQTELDEAMAWYADQAPGLGDAFLLETLKTLRLIEQFPQAWLLAQAVELNPHTLKMHPNSLRGHAGGRCAA
jgi:hypothetical protein